MDRPKPAGLWAKHGGRPAPGHAAAFLSAGAEPEWRILAIPFLACMALVATVFGLPPRVLPSIQAVEGGQPGLQRLNGNGTEDLGLMQVNTIWIEPLSRYSHLPRATVRAKLLNEPCYNIAAAGWIMRTYLDEAGGDLMRAVGNYHSHTEVHHRRYRDKVLQSATTLFGQIAPR